MRNKANKFKQIVLQERGTLLPVAHDAVTALIIERVGFSCFSIGGFGISAASYGYLDTGKISLPEMIDATKRIANIVDIPALVDADTGYGGPACVKKTIQELEKAGAAALFIEDQVWPKRCGHLDGKKIIKTEEMQAKIHAAISARKNKDLMIIARSDAIATDGLNEALRRAHLYIRAGADMIFIEAPTSTKQIIYIARELSDYPLLINLIEGGKTPIIAQQDLARLGFRLIAYPLTSLFASIKSVERSLRKLKINGISKEPNISQRFDDLKSLLKY